MIEMNGIDVATFVGFGSGFHSLKVDISAVERRIRETLLSDRLVHMNISADGRIMDTTFFRLESE